MEEVNLILGKHNSTGKIFYWLNEEFVGFNIGDYAIVENKNDYDLVKVIATITTNKKYVEFITNCKYENIKKIVNIIDRLEIRDD